MKQFIFSSLSPREFSIHIARIAESAIEKAIEKRLAEVEVKTKSEVKSKLNK